MTFSPHAQRAVLLPQHHVIVVELRDGRIGQFDRTGQRIGHDADALGTERAGFGDHAPEEPAQYVPPQKRCIVGHRHQFDGMGVDHNLLVAAPAEQIVVDREV